MDEIIKLLEAAGWTRDGATETQYVRWATTRSPVFGGTGGELRTLGGRIRYAKGDRRVTIGKRTVSFYRVGSEKVVTPGIDLRQRRQASDFENFKTKDIAGIKAKIEREDGIPC